MKFELKKSALVNLTQDNNVVPNELTDKVAGGGNMGTAQCTGWISVVREPGMTDPDDYCENILLP